MAPHFVPFSLTHVLYDDTDPVGRLLALMSLSPVFISVSYATLFASRRDMGTLALGVGQISNEIVNYVLKRALKHARPDSHAHVHIHAPKYGMPSNHAQYMGFFCTYVLVWAVLSWRGHAPSRHSATPWWEKAAVMLGACTLTAAVAYGRLHLGYHTPLQVYAGLGVGAAVAVVWFALVGVLRRRVFAAVTASPIGRCLRLRDVHSVDALAVEYAAVVQAHASAAADATVLHDKRR